MSNLLRLRKGEEIPPEYRLPPDKLLEEMWGTDIREVSGVDMPAIDYPFVLYKSASTYGPRGKPASLDECVEAVLADPDFQPQEGRTPEESAYAICQVQAEKTRREQVGPQRKQEPEVPGAPVEPVAPPAEEAVAGTVELPASPTPWPFSQCISDAMAMGMGRDDATAVCTVIGTDLGDPEDPDTIFLPDGASTESLLSSAAIFGGIAVPEGMGGKGAKQTVQFLGKNQWMENFRQWRGMKSLTPAEKAAGRIQEEVRKLQEVQTKTNQDLRWMAERQDLLLRAILANAGIAVPEPPEEPAAVAEPAKPAEPAAAASGGEPSAGKSLKDMVGDLMEENAQLRAQLAGQPAPVAPAVQPVPAAVAPAAAPAPAAPFQPPVGHELDGAPVLGPEGPAPVTPLMMTPGTVPQPLPVALAPVAVPAAAPPMVAPPAAPAAPMVDPAKAALRKSVDPQSGNGNDGMVYSTPLGAWIPAADREAVRPQR